MGLFRLLFLVAAVFVLYRLWVLLTRDPPRREDQPGRLGEDVVKCAYCAVHVPAHEAVAAGDLHFCSETHRIAFEGKT